MSYPDNKSTPSSSILKEGRKESKYHRSSLPIQRHCEQLPRNATETCQPKQSLHMKRLEVLLGQISSTLELYH